MSTRQDLIIATIRTAVPAGVSWLLAQLLIAVPAVSDVIGWIDEQIASAGFPDWTVEKILGAAAFAGIAAAYYWLVRTLGKRWPVIERFLLGSSRQPTAYTPSVSAR